MKPAKIILPSFFISLLFSCNPPLTYDAVKDDRTSEQLALIKHFAESDSLYGVQYNAIKRAEVRDDEMNGLINFINDTLKNSFNKWPATIHELDVSSFSSDYIDVTFLIPLQATLNEKNPQFSSIVIHATVPFDQTSVKDSLAKARVGEKVWISGDFSKGGSDEVTISGYLDPENPFQNPKLGATLTKVAFESGK